MKTIAILLILLAVVLGFGITLVSGLYQQTLLPANLWAGNSNTWGGLPFGWWGYSQVGHVYQFNPPYWFSPTYFLSDVVFWFLISTISGYVALRLVKMKQERQIHSIST
jgi:hypothetical protein